MWSRRPSRRNPGRPGEQNADLDGHSGPDDGKAEALAGRSVDAGTIANAGFGGDDHEGEWVTVFSAGSFEEAHIVKGRLESEDIPVLLRYSSLSRVYGSAIGYGGAGVEVRVPRLFEDRARAELES